MQNLRMMKIPAGYRGQQQSFKTAAQQTNRRWVQLIVMRRTVHAGDN